MARLCEGPESSEAPATGVAYASQTLSNREKTGTGGERP